MQYRTLGRTGLEISLVSLGTGGPSGFGQSTGKSADDQYALVHGAIDLGVNFFDTAAGYRESEVLLGQALADIPRDKYILATKASISGRGYDGEMHDEDEIISQCERSLERLQTNVIDVYQLHGVLPDRYDEVVQQIYPALLKLQEQGKIRFIGVTELFFSDTSHEMLKRAVPSGLWDSVMLKYGILNMAAGRDVLPLCVEHDVGVLNMAPVRVKLTRPAELRALLDEWTSRGLLAKDSLPGDDPLGWLIDGETSSAIAAGYKFAAEPAAITTVLTGTSNLEHLKENSRAILGSRLPAAHVARLKELFGEIVEGA